MGGQPEFQSNQPKNLMQPFPLPGDALHEIWSQLAIYFFETVNRQRQRAFYYSVSSLSSFLTLCFINMSAY